MEVIKLLPACKDYLWGGSRLKTEFGKHSEKEIIAETWELSCHPDGPSTIAEGTHKGKTLVQYLSDQEKSMLGTNCAQLNGFPLLIKLIDAQKDLSVQVHPNDTYAQRVEHQLGKTEMWYVIDCKPGASLYYGLSCEQTKEELHKHIEDGTLLQVLNRKEVHPGDVFFIEAGTIHAIGAGILIAEIQENSNVTYRVYDYNRTDAQGNQRELHVQKALDVANLRPAPVRHWKKHLASCRYFTVDKLKTDSAAFINVDQKSFHHLLCLSGNGKIDWDGGRMIFNKGDSLFIPAGLGGCTLNGCFEALHTWISDPPVYRIGIDLGGTNIAVGVVDENYRIVAKYSVPTASERPYQEIVEDMAQAVHKVLRDAGISIEQCCSIGIGSPGICDSETGTVLYTNNLNWKDVPLAATLQKWIDLPCYLSNDANCAALGEVAAGAAKGCKNAVLITLGTGVGGGVVLDGKIFSGCHSAGAELGHTVLVKDGELCTCGRHGCLEAYASASALIRQTKRAAQEHPESAIWALCGGNLEHVSGRTSFEAERLGDETARQVVNAYISYLSEGVLNFVNIFRPECIILGGGICNEGARLLDPINTYVRQYCFGGEIVTAPKVIKAALGNDAGIIGAALLC
nr:type I phosphomannose isomerase catalytic subunit [uncultured Caproiciproducens sp.]